MLAFDDPLGVSNIDSWREGPEVRTVVITESSDKGLHESEYTIDRLNVLPMSAEVPSP